ncbi:unnamed protein product [Clonostachys rosea]|uniref:Amine oxidase n=1 Tax=Bionectria ochroleuca TaxID=29856 RepID=A0ABY6USW8_BIOOC|nr:unnamed protein product [Clonostachys rosea]
MSPRVKQLDLENTSKVYHAPATVTAPGVRLIHVSGQVGATKDNHVPADYESQIQLALFNLRKIMVAAGATVNDIAKLCLYIVNYDPAHRKHTRHIQRFLRGHRPAITLVPVAQLAIPGWLFEIDAVIACPEPTPSVPRSLGESQLGASSVDVIVIGAGLAGLSAARDVIASGLSCVVLESRDRVGGRTWSRPTSDKNGILEYGAAWINDVNQTKMIGLARRYGVELIEQNTTGNCLIQDADGRIGDFAYGELPKFDKATADDVARIRDTCEADCQALDTANPKATSLDAMTFEAYLKSLNASETSIATATVWTRAMLGVEPSELSALFFLNYCKSGGGLLNMRSDRKGGGQHLRIRQGTQSFSTGLASELPSDTVRLNTAVSDIKQYGPGVVEVVTENGETYRGRKVITTIPSPALKTINFEPKLDPVKLAWSESARYGYYNKAILLFKTPFWVEKGFCGLVQSFVGPASVIRDTSSPADGKHAFTCFMVGAPGAEWGALPEEQRKEQLLAQIGALYGDRARVDADFVEMQCFDWAQDRWTGGGCPCASLPPGVLDSLSSGSLRQPLGNLHFAGTETAAEWKGYMEGAVRSGERAAQEVIQDFAKYSYRL